jgi:hypothetical protein
MPSRGWTVVAIIGVALLLYCFFSGMDNEAKRATELWHPLTAGACVGLAMAAAGVLFGVRS